MLTLPHTPALPNAKQSGFAPVNGVRLWYAVFGMGEPVIFLHGGLANSNYWANQVAATAEHYRILVVDSRGHGRSSWDDRPLSYDVLAADFVALMDFLGMRQAAIVGWSDGAIAGLTVAMNYPDRLTKLFAFAANSDPSGLHDMSHSAIFNEYLARTKLEYEKLSPTPTQYAKLFNAVSVMWKTQPNFTAPQLRRIGSPTWIVHAEHDEVVKRENTELLARSICGAHMVTQRNVGHFSFLQDAEQFTGDVLKFMQSADRKA